jgi:hypothetical protein
MAKRTNRMIWPLAGVLAVFVLTAGGWLFVNYERRLPLTQRVAMWLPPSRWGFGRVAGYTPKGAGFGKWGGRHTEWLRLGRFAVRLK